MATKSGKLAIKTRSASFDEDAGTVEIVYATSTRADRYDYVEELVISEEAIDASRLDAGAVNLIVDHMPFGLPLGRVVAHRIEDGQAVAVVKLTQDREHAGIIANIRAGVIATVSVGYQISGYEMLEQDGDGALPLMRVTRWMPAEISLVTLPADPLAQIRSGKTAAALVRRTVTAAPKQKDSTMKTKKQMKRDAVTEAVSEVVDETGAEQTPELEAAVEDAITAAVEEVVKDVEDGTTDENTEDPAADETATDAAKSADTADMNTEDEGTRAAQILELCTRHGLSVAFASRHVKAKTSVRAVKDAILDALAKRSAPPMSTARITRDSRETETRQASNAIHARLAGRGVSEADGGHFRNLRLVDIARDLTGADRGMSDETVIHLALRGGMNSSSDFSFTSVVGGAVERRIKDAAAQVEIALMPLVRETLVSNFLPVNTYSVGGFPELKETPEGAEYEAGTISTEAGQFSISKFGRILNLTFEALVNDDLRMLDTSIRGAASRGVMLRQSKIRAAFGAKLSDGKTLFHASRGNAINAELSLDGLSAARLALRKQKDIDGNEMGLTAKFLVVSPELETQAYQLVSPITAAVTGEVNVFAGTLTVIVDSMLGATEWILAADPAMADCIELADLRGYEGVRVDEVINPMIDGLSYRARAFAGAHPTGWRGMVKSTGNGL